MFPVKKSFGCSGWGCLTLLMMAVVMWLAFFLPSVLKPGVTHANYSARVWPNVADVRTKIGLYMYVSDKLPGINVVRTGCGGQYASPVQTFILKQNASDGKYAPAYCADDYRTVIPVQDGDQSQPLLRHFATDVGLEASELRDSMCTPAGYRYWATVASSNAYVYCIGYFPSEDCHMTPGTGYAVLEISATDKSVRRTATWERYKPIDSARIVLRPATNAVETAQSAGERTCWLGHPELYLSDKPEKVEKGIRELKNAGWSFDDD